MNSSLSFSTELEACLVPYLHIQAGVTDISNYTALANISLSSENVLIMVNCILKKIKPFTMMMAIMTRYCYNIIVNFNSYIQDIEQH